MRRQSLGYLGYWEQGKELTIVFKYIILKVKTRNNHASKVASKSKFYVILNF